MMKARLLYTFTLCFVNMRKRWKINSTERVFCKISRRTYSHGVLYNEKATIKLRNEAGVFRFTGWVSRNLLWPRSWLRPPLPTRWGHARSRHRQTTHTSSSRDVRGSQQGFISAKESLDSWLVAGKASKQAS